MRRRKKPKRQIAKPTTRLIVGIILALTLPFCLLCKFIIEQHLPWWIAVITSGLMSAYCIYVYLKEKRDDKKFRNSLGSLRDNTYFTSSEWREKYLEWVQEKSYEVPSKKGMRADLTARFRKNQSFFLWFIGLMMIPLAVFLFYSFKNDEDLNEYPIFAGIYTCVIPLISIIIGIVIIRFNFRVTKAYPVENFYYMMESVGEIADIEKSYKHGKIFSNKHNGVNIGAEYTLIYDQSAVYEIKSSDIITIARYVVRQKKYDKYDFFYRGDKYAHFLYINAKPGRYLGKFYVELDEFQVEAALNELFKFAKYREANSVYEKHMLNNKLKNN